MFSSLTQGPSSDPAAPPVGKPDATGLDVGILVVDAEASVRASLRACLEHLGFRVWSVASGWEALEVYRGRGGRIGLVLLDMHLPGLDGPGTLAQLRQINPAVKGCYLNRRLRGRATETLDGIPVLGKPFDATRFACAVRNGAEVFRG
jgi:CheY-like chemotaxis protein